MVYIYTYTQVMPHYISCFHAVKNISQRKEETSNMPSDKTEQVTSGII